MITEGKCPTHERKIAAEKHQKLAASWVKMIAKFNGKQLFLWNVVPKTEKSLVIDLLQLPDGISAMSAMMHDYDNYCVTDYDLVFFNVAK